MPNDPAAYDSSDQATVDNAAKEEKRRDNADNETIRVWMEHRNGRSFLYRFVYTTCHMGQTFVGYDDAGRSDPLRTYLQLGERNIGALLDEQLRRHPDLYMKMLKEAQTDEELRKSRLERANEPET